MRAGEAWLIGTSGGGRSRPRCAAAPLWVVSRRNRNLGHAPADMKVHLDIDCSPEEARAFFGLPDVGPLQQKLMQEVEARTLAAMHAMDPDTLLKTWLPASMQGFEQLQKMFWGAAGEGASRSKEKR